MRTVTGRRSRKVSSHRRVRPALPPSISVSREPIAIVGIGCRFPGEANSPEAFWRLLEHGVDAITEVPPERWDIDAFYDPDPTKPGKMNTRWGGFLKQIDQFDYQFFGISPREAANMDPQQRLILEVAWEALDDSGQVLEHLTKTPVGVFIGLSSYDYGVLQFTHTAQQKDPYAATGSALSIIANRLSYALDLRGPSLAVDTACSSSLVAIHLACQSLLNGECDSALVGGVNAILVPQGLINFTKARMLSPDGRCKSFDERANGFVRSEGAGIVLLKPLSRAVADGDTIYAVIKGSAVNQDGHTNGMTVPSQTAQEAVMQDAYQRAGINPRQVQYIEAHGTGTAVGDPIEAMALGRVLRTGRAPHQPCIIGSVKTNIGHLEPAAGIAGLIKVALMLRHRMIPANLHFQRPNPAIPFQDLQLSVQTALGPWPDPSSPLIAGVNSFGFGGTNAHVVLEEAPRVPAATTGGDGHDVAGPFLLPLSARSPNALHALTQSYVEYVNDTRNEDLSFRDLCYSASLRRNHHDYRLAVIGHSWQELRQQLERMLAGAASSGLSLGRKVAASRPKLAFVFSGQGPQWWGMGRELLSREPVFRQALERADALIRQHAGWSLLQELAADEAHTRVNDTEIAQPCLFALQTALAALWGSWGVVPNAVVGHSVGEVTAAHVAGALSLNDAIRVIVQRGRFMHQASGRGKMAAVQLLVDEAQDALRGYEGRVCIAAINSPGAVTLSGDAEALETLIRSLEQRGVICRFLRVNCAFHSHQMRPFQREFVRALKGIRPRPTSIPMISTLTGQPCTGKDLNAEHWSREMQKPVRFSDAVGRLADDDYRVFVELSPHPVLAGNIAQCLRQRGQEATVLPSLRREEEERAVLLDSLGTLYTIGYPVDWHALFPTGGRALRLPSYPWQRERCWLDLSEAAAAAPTTQASRSATGSQRHPLLGQRFRSARPAAPDQFWELELDREWYAYFEQHRVQGVAILPAAAYVEMVLAAATEAFGKPPAALSAIEFRKAMFLPQNATRILQVLLSPGVMGEMSFHIYSRDSSEGPQDHAWTLHATGTIQSNRPEEIPQAPEGLEAIRTRCTQAFSSTDYYVRLNDRGFQYGPLFQGIEQLWRRDDEAVAQLRLPEELEPDRERYYLHPTILDAGFQVLIEIVAAAATNGSHAEIYVPVRLRQLRVYARPGARLWSHGVVRERRGDTVECEVRLFDDAGRMVVEAIGVCLQRVESSTPREQAASFDDWLYELQWHPKARPARAAGRRTPLELLRPAQIAMRLQPKSAVTLEELQRYQEVVRHVDVVSTMHFVNALRALGWDPPAGQRISAASLAEQLGVVPQHRRFFGRILEILEADGALKKVGAEWDVCRLPAREDPQGRWEALLAQWPAWKTELTLLRRFGLHLAEVFRGKQDPLELLFPGGSFTDAEQLYISAPFSGLYNPLVQGAVTTAFEGLPEDRTVRILEIGAGTGGIASHIVPALPAHRADYAFTDISAMFTARAQQKFRQYPFVRYGLLNIEQDPEPQGFASQGFEVILAANVLHATGDLRKTLRHIRQLLAPNGLLVLLEMTTPMRTWDLMFGVMPGLWKFTDAELRPSHPLLSQPAWRDLLSETGFTDVVGVPEVAPGTQAWQSLMLARNPHAEPTVAPTAPRGRWLIFADEGGTGQQLADRLRAEGEPCVLVGHGGAYARLEQDRFQVHPERPEDVQRLFEAVLASDQPACRGIIHLWSLDAQPPNRTTLASLEEAQRLGCISVLHVVQTLARVRGTTPPRLWLVTRGAQAVGAEASPVSVAQSPLWGFEKTVAYEDPALRCTMVDLNPQATSDDADALVEEVLADDAERQVAFRAGGRHVARLVRYAPQARLEERRPFLPAQDRNFSLHISTPGTLEDLRLRVSPRRSPGPGEVEIEVRAAGLNFRDLMLALGLLPPEANRSIEFGFDCAGRITAVGEGVQTFRVGDDVMTMTSSCFSAYTTAPAIAVVPKPPQLSFEEAATIPVCFLTTCYALLHLGKLAKGERVLIHSAAGGVGLAAVQIAQWVGAEIFATAGSPEKRELLRSLGVQHVLDSRSLEFADEILKRTGGRGVDVVLNSLSGEFLTKSLSVLAPYGRFLEIGKRDIFQDSPIGLRPFEKSLSFFTVDLVSLGRDHPALIGSLLAEIADRLKDGTFKPLPRQVFPMSEIVSAFRHMAQAKHVGKIVLSMSDQQLEVTPAAGRPTGFRADRTYLITGGLGGLGLAVAQRMVHQGARHLVLMGRRGASTPAAQDAVQAMQAAGAEVTVAAADVADAAQLAKVLDDIRQSRPPLGGIMHTAGILDDGILLELDQARFRSVMAPKVEGSWNLHTQTLDTPLDFFVLFSSAVSLLGSPGQANYSAACAFLDALAHHRRALGLPALTVNWGVWSEVGLAASPERGGRLVSLGFGQMTPTQGVDALGHVLGHNASQLAVLPINWPVWRQAMQPVSDLPVFESLMREHAASGQNTHATVIRETLSAAQPGERQRVLEEYVLAQVAKVLGLAPAKLDVQQPLNKVGLDSLMAVEVKNRIELDLGVVIPTVELLEGPTIVQLAARVLTQLPTAPDARPSEPSARPQAGAAEQPALAGTISRVEANEMLAQVDQLSAEKVETLLQKLLAEEQQEEKRKP